MARIRQLSHQVITQIAAGEVIERPASVVKEMLENSVDAGATRIDIDLEAGGTDLIRVVDNGHGIDAEDLALAFATHATSKLQSAEDLFNIATMGFRGEALASIGGVAQVTLQSRPPTAERGAEIQCNGGIFTEVRPWSGTPGTRIEARNLFFNIPVRKKFLKSVATELGHVCETVTRLALANPSLHIVLRHNNKLVYEIPATASLLDRIGLFFGGEVREALYLIESPPGPHRLTGYIGDPKCDRGNAKLQYFFVNGRWFRDRSLAHAFQEAYRNLIMVGRYPVGFLFLTVPTDQVDVNVHPTKSEVRFRENSLLYSMIRSTVKNRLLGENLVPELRAPVPELTAPRPMPTFSPPPLRRDFPTLPPPRLSEPEWPIPPRTPPTESPRRETAEATTAPWEAPPPVEPQPQTEAAPTPTTPELPLFSLPATLAPGSALQVHDAYLVLETNDGMLVIDQHALHERILFEQLRQRVREGRLEVQRLLIPEPIELPPEQAVAVLEVKDALAELGLQVEDFGGNTILLSSYPTLLKRRAPYEILLGVVDYLVSKDCPPIKEVMLDHLLATMACKAAVKAGDRLTPEEIQHLLELRKLAEDSHHCPHGRPTSLLFSRAELDRQFRRT
ncbi:MAG: DNA mismatch repair endonuclease MutL [Fimbriiglobus sp.]